MNRLSEASYPWGRERVTYDQADNRIQRVCSVYQIDSDDPHLVNVFSTTVLEILGNDKAILETAKKYMAPKTMQLQIEAGNELGR